MMKLGVIGGLGPLATAYFYELLTKMSDVSCDQEHLEIIIYSCPSIPDRTQFILDQQNSNPVIKMKEIAQILEKQGVDFIAIPCITAHFFHNELSESIHVPIIHLVEEMTEYLKLRHIDKVGIMATDGTLSTSLFQNQFKRNNIESVVPHYQSDVMHLIYNNVKLGKEIEMNRFYKVSDDLFHQGAHAIILGCTELSIIKKENKLDDRYLDAMELLAAVALKKCHIPIKKEYQYLVREE